MPTEILMPALSPTMEEGKLAKWLVKEGQQVKAGDIIAEIETDKATMEVEAVDEGKVGQLLVAEGTEGVKVNTPIAVLLAEGEKRAARPAPAAPTPQRRTSGEAPRGAAAASASAAAHHTGAPRQRLPARSAAAAPARASRLPASQRSHGSAHLRLAAGAPAGQGRRASTWRRWRARARTGASSSATSRRRSATACARRRAKAGTASRRRRSTAPAATLGAAADGRRQDPGALREGLLRGRAARRHAQGDRRSA